MQSKGGLPPDPGSPFNIKAESLTLRNFDRDEIAELYAQHTDDTGQPFTDDAVDRAWFWTRGQPFLVNALAYHLTRRDPVPAPTPITGDDIDRAKEALVLAVTAPSRPPPLRGAGPPGSDSPAVHSTPTAEPAMTPAIAVALGSTLALSGTACATRSGSVAAAPADRAA
ncbi:MAG: hypothetical protein D6798_04145, partial [Deltaproteobacteria bacterium]